MSPCIPPQRALHRAVAYGCGALAWQLLVGCGDDESSTSGGAPPTAPVHVVDLVADNNRDGIIDPTDPSEQHQEHEWTPEHGACFLANLDDDDLDGLPDAADTGVPLGADELDLARVMARAWPEVPSGASGLLEIDPGAAPFVRLFLRQDDGSWELVGGSVGPCDAGGDPSCEYVSHVALTDQELASGAELGIEARTLAGTHGASSWSGLAKLGLTVFDAAGRRVLTADNPADGTDWVTLRVAPWLALGNLAAHDTVFVPAQSPAFATALSTHVEAAGLTAQLVHDWPERWLRDFFRMGYAAVPASDGQIHGMRIALARPWGLTDADEDQPIRYLRSHVLDADTAVVAIHEPGHQGTAFDSFGAHLLVPPYEQGAESFRLGRLVTAEGALDQTLQFYAAQGVQAPSLTVDTSWLASGHLDAIISFVPAATPRGWKLLAASPAVAEQLLLAWQAAGHGSAELFAEKYGWAIEQGQPSWGPAALSIDALLADPSRAAANQLAQARIDEAVDEIAAATGLAADDIVPLPALFASVAAGGLVPLMPAAVDALVLDDAIILPAPCGPQVAGEDGFEQELRTRLSTDAHALGGDGQGLSVHFIDDWYDVHLAHGELHRATNQSGPPATATWWTERP